MQNAPAFAPRAGRLTGMTETRPKSILLSMRASELRGRGAVYRWLHKNYRQVSKGFAKTESTWEGVIDALVAAGVTNRTGGRPSTNSVLKVWQRVCEDRVKRAKQTKRKPPDRSRPAGAWSAPERVRGPPAQPDPLRSRSARIPASRHPASQAEAQSAKPTGLPQDLPDHVRENLAALRRQFAHTDRHIVQPADED